MTTKSPTTAQANSLSNDEKYTIADALAKAYKGKFSNEELSTGYAFGVILHTPNKENVEMIDKLGFDDASHIVNLTIKKIKKAIVSVTADF